MNSILILCTGNACRSQMAEGIIRTMSNNTVHVESAGIYPTCVDERAVKVMQEIGIDISYYRAKPVENFVHASFDLVLTLCDNAKEHCPMFPGITAYLHWNIPNPAESMGSEEEILDVFRHARDEIIGHVRNDLCWRIGKEWMELPIAEPGGTIKKNPPTGSPGADQLEKES